MGNINIFLVGIEGLLSFLSPCILPLLPVYLSILTSSEENLDKKCTKTLLANTLAFILGISSTFFILGMSVHTLGSLLKSYQTIFSLVGGIIVIIMGLFYMDVLQIKILNHEKRFRMKINKMNPISAFILGITFSFGWTPCIGPTLASVLVMASTSSSHSAAMALILIYTIGFTIPFLILSICYGKLVDHLDKLRKHMGFIKKLGGLIIILSGIVMMIAAGKDFVSSHQRTVQDNSGSGKEHGSQTQEENNLETSTGEPDEDRIKALDFELYDQYGKEHVLEEYKGKVVFLNFWGTWCPPCKEELPYIEELYKEYGENSEEVIILGIVNPDLGSEGNQEYIESFLEERGYNFPVVFDSTHELLYRYGLSAFPSTLIIDAEGYINLYVPGAMSKETMKQIIEEAMSS